jgi:hypothetical protein
MMNEVRLEKVFKATRNYDDIVNFNYGVHDFVSKKIINYYQDYVLDSDNRVDNQNLLEFLDISVNEYIKNPKFYKYVQNAFQDIISNEIVYIMINLYKQYEEDKIKDIENTKWL